MVESSRKGAATSSAYGYIDGVKIMYAKEMLSGSDFTLEGTFNVDADGKLEGHEVEVEGTKAKGGYLTYNNGKITKGCLTIGDYKVTIENDTAKETIKGACEVAVPQAKSFADDSWATIIANVRAGNTDAYNVGDTKEVILTSDDEEIAGTYTLRIANKSTPSECSQEDFSQTACGFVIEFEDIITTHEMDTKDTIMGGWPATELYGYLTNNIYNALPNDLKLGIRDTIVISKSDLEDKPILTTTDKLYLLSPSEVFGGTKSLDYYKNHNSSWCIKKYNGSAENWWLRDAYASSGGIEFESLDIDCDNVSVSPTNINGVSPAFRIG